MDKILNPISPGAILLEEFMIPLDISQNQLARDIDVPPTRINDIVHDKRGITADTALRFSKYFGTTPEFWLTLQLDYDLRCSKLNSWPNIEPRIRSYLPHAKGSALSRKKHSTAT